MQARGLQALKVGAVGERHPFEYGPSQVAGAVLGAHTYERSLHPGGYVRLPDQRKVDDAAAADGALFDRGVDPAQRVGAGHRGNAETAEIFGYAEEPGEVTRGGRARFDVGVPPFVRA